MEKVWFMPCPICGHKVNKNYGNWYKEDVKINSTWRTVLKRKINYDCSNKSCSYTKTETEKQGKHLI